MGDSPEIKGSLQTSLKKGRGEFRGDFEWGGDNQPWSSEHWESPLWLVFSPQRLLWFTPSHWGPLPEVDGAGNVSQHIKTIYFMSYHTALQVFVLSWTPLGLLLNYFFYLFVGNVEAERGCWAEEICSQPRARGTSWAVDGLVGNSCQLAGGPCRCQGPWSWWVDSPSFWDPILKFQRGWASSTVGQPPKRACSSPPPMMPAFSKEDEPMLQMIPLAQGPTEAIAGLLGSSMLPTDLPRVLSGPYHTTGLTLPAKAFKQVSLKGSSKIYRCREYDKTCPNWDTMVSHYLKEHLRVCLVCPKGDMRYLNPSNFHCHGRETHNLLFY